MGVNGLTMQPEFLEVIGYSSETAIRKPQESTDLNRKASVLIPIVHFRLTGLMQ